MASGKLIVLYGINNIGKSTQAQRLVERLQAAGIPAQYLKYPRYDLEPSGGILNAYLRQGNPDHLSAREAQIFFAMNRFHFQSQLKAILESGITVVAEDYTDTGIAWGVGAGVAQDFLKRINAGLVPPDLAIYMVGERFTDGKETGHRHEEDDALVTAVRAAHDQLASESGWQRVDANQTIDEVTESIWAIVSPLLFS